MSDFLASFVNDDIDPGTPKDNKSAGISFIDNTRDLPRKRQISGRGKFYKKDDNIHVLFRYRGQSEEEIIIPPLKKTNMIFLNKSVIFYGPSGSGKTKAIYNYMYIMYDIFPTVFVFAPTENQKGDFGQHVPIPLIFEEFGVKEVRNIYLRQKAATSIYNNANNLKVLHNLFIRVANGKAVQFQKKLILLKEKAKHQTAGLYSDSSVRKAKIEEIEDLFKYKLIRFYKKIIGPHIRKLQTQELSKEEKFAIKYLNFNPRTLIVFDDATTELLELIKEGKKKVKGEITKDGEIIKHFFFKGRWASITHWYAFHDDNKLDTDIRKNAFYSVFCDKQVALAFFQRTANSFTTVEKKRAETVINAVFDEKTAPKWAKLVYSRMEKKFYYLVADDVPDNFQMCSHAVRKYCAQIVKKESGMDMNNPFSKKFEEFINF
jgi:hypothetical protein